MSLLRVGRGAAQSNVNLSILKKLEIPLPSIEKQRSLAERLETLMSRTSQVRSLREKALIDTKLIMKSELHHVFSEGEKCGWSKTKLGEISEWITKGATPTTYGYAWQDQGIIFVRNQCVRREVFSLEGSLRISKEAHSFMKRSQIKAGDILVTITGDIGRACIFPNNLGEANINQHIARVRIKPQINARAQSFMAYFHKGKFSHTIPKKK